MAVGLMHRKWADKIVSYEQNNLLIHFNKKNSLKNLEIKNIFYIFALLNERINNG